MADNFTICVGTVGTGAWVSPDGGESWRQVRRVCGPKAGSSGLPSIRKSRAPSSPAPMTASTTAKTAASISSGSTRR